MINMHFQIASFFYMVMVLIVFFAKNRVKNFETDIFSVLSITNIIGIIIDIIVVYFGYYDPYNNIVYILNRFYLSYIIIWVSLFSLYIFKVTIPKSTNNKYGKIIDIIYFLSIIIAIIFVFILPLNLYNNNGVMYSYGKAISEVVIISVIHTCIILGLIILYRKRLSYHKYIPIAVLVILCIIALIARSINPGLLLTTFIITFINIVMFFTIENPDMKLIEQLNIARDQAEKANSAKTDFLSSMSHEIRTPLNAIVGFSNSLYENEKLPADLKNDVKDILTASDNLLEIVNGVLDISKIEANKIEIINKEYDTKKMFDELTKLTKVRINEKPIEFITKFDESIPRVLYGDQIRVKQVILNVLTNAAKYTDKGKIIFTTKSIIKDGIVRMIISVEDTGRGIKKENIDKLFTKFERLEEDRNTTIEGTGLGLAITKKLLELMNGKIIVQSEYGKGSIFTIVLDQKIVKNPTIALADEDNANKKIEDLRGKKVLVVDDNKLNIKVAVRLLTPYNLTIESAESGFETIDKLKENNSYDLILMDDMMPKMSGTETLKKIKEESLYDGPIVALTANALTGMKEKYIESGFSDYLAKPIEKPELNRVLKKYLKK